MVRDGAYVQYTPRFVVEMRDGAIRGFGDIVSAKRFLDSSDDATRAVRASDGEVMARKTRVADAEMTHLASLFRKHD